MLVLFETPAGYALFKVADEGKLSDVKNIHEHFSSANKASSLVKLQAFKKFEDTAMALDAAASVLDTSMNKDLKKFLKKNIVKAKLEDTLAVADGKLGGIIKDKLSIKCVHNDMVNELFRGIRLQMSELLTGMPEKEYNSMTLGLSHSLCRYKLKFSPDKVDTMIIQAIGLLDELDKELNTYAMRVKEWYGWHFPEMGKIVSENALFAQTVKSLGFRTNAQDTDLSSILPEETEAALKEAAKISMGTEISDEDILNIKVLCDQVLTLTDYRASLFEYLRNRMNAIAPNLTVMVGELVGARLIAHAGSLMNLAKQPASTVQILGAEKALFRALKTKHATPKYGLIYHASLVGQSSAKNKGKMSRVLASKTALAVRVDALGEEEGVTLGYETREAVERRLRDLEGNHIQVGSITAPQQQKVALPTDTSSYNTAADMVTDVSPEKAKKRKNKDSEDKKSKKKKKSDKHE